MHESWPILQKIGLCFDILTLELKLIWLISKSLHFGNLNVHAKLEKLWPAGDTLDI